MIWVKEGNRLRVRGGDWNTLLKPEHIQFDSIDTIYQRMLKKYHGQPWGSHYWKWRSLVTRVWGAVIEDYIWTQAPPCPGPGVMLTVRVNEHCYRFKGHGNKFGVPCWKCIFVPGRESEIGVEYKPCIIL